MEEAKAIVLLIIIFLFSFGVQVYCNLNTETFGDSESYFVMRQVENIHEGHPISFKDELSFGGKFSPFLPTYYYFVSLNFTLGKAFAVDIFPAIVAGLISIMIYLIASEMTKDKGIRLLVAFVGGTFPSLLRLSMNTLTADSVTILIFLVNALLLIKLEKTKRVLPLLFIFSTVMALLSPISLMLVGVIWIYIALMKLQGAKLFAKTFEFSLFFTMLTFIVNYLVYVKAGLEGGMSGLFVHSSNSVAALKLSSISWISAFSGLSLFVLIMGVFGLYNAAKRANRKSVNSLLLSIALTALLGAGLRLLKWEVALAYLGIALAIASVYSTLFIFRIIRRSRFKALRTTVFALFILLAVVPLVLSTMQLCQDKIENPVPKDLIDSLVWIKQHSNPENAVLGPVEYGHLISHFSSRKNVADTNFIGVHFIETRLNDISRAYTSKYVTEALRIFDKYNIKYIVFNDFIKQKFNILGIEYITEQNCFELVFNKTTQVYEVKCKLK